MVKFRRITLCPGIPVCTLDGTKYRRNPNIVLLAQALLRQATQAAVEPGEEVVIQSQLPTASSLLVHLPPKVAVPIRWGSVISRVGIPQAASVRTSLFLKDRPIVKRALTRIILKKNHNGLDRSE